MANDVNQHQALEADGGAGFDKGFAESKTSRLITIASIAGVAGALAIYILRLDRVVGLFVDDGWYVLLAKSLATGQGYSLINSPTTGILPLYPPAFPFLLSLFYRIWPSFPDNIYLLKSVSVVAMMVVGVIAYRYFVRERKLPAHLALGISFAAVVSPPLVFIATSTVMSECVFALVFLITIVVMEKCVRAGQGARGIQLALTGAALASTAFLTRSIGVALVAAGFLYLLKARLIKSAIVFTVAVAAFAGPWVIYTRLHTPTPEQRKEQGGHIVLPYTDQFWQKRAGFTHLGTVTIADLPERVVNNVIEITGRDIGRIVVTPLFEMMRDPFAEAQREDVQAGGRGSTWSVSFFLSIFAIIGLIAMMRQRVTMSELAVPLSLAITVLWPWETFRFVLPLIPFVIFYFVIGVRAIYSLLSKNDSQRQWAVATAFVLLIAAINLYGNLTFLAKKLDTTALDRPQWLQIFDEAETMFKWVNERAAKTDVIATANPPLVHLYTGVKTVSSDDPATNWDNWNRLGVRYLVRASVFPEIPDPSERKFSTVYRARGVVSFRVIDLGQPDSRPAW
ncbi:MAG: hypothetical protein AB7U82_19080 [Blastocatellales bacterium]